MRSMAPHTTANPQATEKPGQEADRSAAAAPGFMPHISMKERMNRMSVLISVVIPIYNQERYIEECLNSVFPQCTDEVEVILVNDGSTDRSREICESILNAHPSVHAELINQQNSGSMISRVNGIARACGEYIQFVDSDDLLLEGALGTVLEEIRRSHADMICFNATCDADSHAPYFSIPLPHGRLMTGEERYEIHRLLCETDAMNNLWTKCIKRALFDRAALPDSKYRLTNGEDLYHILALADQAQSFVYLDRTLYFYRVMQNSISRVYNPFYFQSEKVVCAKRLAYAEKWSKQDELISGVRVQTYKIMREVARKLLISGKPWKEIREEMGAFRNDPFFREYYLLANDAPDRRDVVLKGPMPLMHLAAVLYDVKAKLRSSERRGGK